MGSLTATPKEPNFFILRTRPSYTIQSTGAIVTKVQLSLAVPDMRDRVLCELPAEKAPKPETLDKWEMEESWVVISAEYQQHQALNYVTLALLAITFVIVGGMDLTLLNLAVELRDSRLRGVDPSSDPYTKGARLQVWLVSLIESATFISVSYQLEKPASFSPDLSAAIVAWGFIVARALIAPVCAMYLATLGKRAMVRREMYGNLLLTIGGTIQQILENLQFAADERLIEPLWRMQVLVDRASRAATDAEMDAFDDDLLKALGELRHLRDQLRTGSTEPALAPVPADKSGRYAPSAEQAEGEVTAEAVPPLSLPVATSQPMAWPTQLNVTMDSPTHLSTMRHNGTHSSVS